jgi:hypothetical protein
VVFWLETGAKGGDVVWETGGERGRVSDGGVLVVRFAERMTGLGGRGVLFDIRG